MSTTANAGGRRSHGGFELEPVETCSVDELRALQLERLRWSLAHAYDNVAHCRAKFDAAGVRPQDLRSEVRLKRFSIDTGGGERLHHRLGN